MKQKPDVIKTIFFDDQVKGRKVTENVVDGLRVMNVVEAAPQVRLARGETPREALAARPSKTKTYLFDDSLKEKSEKTVDLEGLQAVIVSEPTPMMRLKQGGDSDWADLPAGANVATKVIHYDDALRGKTVKQTMVDGMPTIVVAEPTPAMRR